MGMCVRESVSQLGPSPLRLGRYTKILKEQHLFITPEREPHKLFCSHMKQDGLIGTVKWEALPVGNPVLCN